MGTPSISREMFTTPIWTPETCPAMFTTPIWAPDTSPATLTTLICGPFTRRPQLPKPEICAPQISSFSQLMRPAYLRAVGIPHGEVCKAAQLSAESIPDCRIHEAGGLDETHLPADYVHEPGGLEPVHVAKHDVAQPGSLEAPHVSRFKVRKPAHLEPVGGCRCAHKEVDRERMAGTRGKDAVREIGKKREVKGLVVRRLGGRLRGRLARRAHGRIHRRRDGRCNRSSHGSPHCRPQRGCRRHRVIGARGRVRGAAACRCRINRHPVERGKRQERPLMRGQAYAGAEPAVSGIQEDSVCARLQAEVHALAFRLVQLDSQHPPVIPDVQTSGHIFRHAEAREAARRSVSTRSPEPVRLMSYAGCCGPYWVFSVEASVSWKANAYASFRVTTPSPTVSAAPRRPEIR